jgi:orotidine-5'-phosphate decarboxylase
MVKKVICALDTGELDEAIAITKRLGNVVGAFKIGHSLTLQHGLDVVSRLQDAGANRIFLDLKFHDIPNSVALAVREATRRGVWMMTVHISGGPAMMTAAVAEARDTDGIPPLLVGVSVLTSLDQHVLTDHLGVQRSIPEHMAYLSQLAIDCDLDGVVCSPQEVKEIRKQIGSQGVIVTPGIRVQNIAVDEDDQRRTGSPSEALSDGADYLVIGRALINSEHPEWTLEEFGLVGAPN